MQGSEVRKVSRKEGKGYHILSKITVNHLKKKQVSPSNLRILRNAPVSIPCLMFFAPIFWGLVSPKKIPKTSTHLAQHGRPQRSTIQGDDLQTENAMITLLGLWNQLLNINIYIVHIHILYLLLYIIYF